MPLLLLPPLLSPLLLPTRVDGVHSIHTGHGGSGVMTLTSFLGRRASCGCGGLQIEGGWQGETGFTRSEEA